MNLRHFEPGSSPSQHRLHAARHGGFTLIELLVVMAVLSVLLATLLPALSAARRIARRSACQGNLSQIARAWLMYLNDYEGRFYKGASANIDYGGWRGMDPSLNGTPRPLNPYMGLPVLTETRERVGAFRCPGDDGRFSGMLPWYVSVGTSYQTNVLLIGDPWKGWLPGKTLLAEINKRINDVTLNDTSNHSQLPLIGDYGWANCWEPVLPYMGDFHQRRCCHNVAFVDGHVAFLRIRKGLYVTDEYTVLPFKDLYRLAREEQKEEECR